MSIVDTKQRMVIFGECMVELRSTQRESSVSTCDENTDNNLMAKSFAGDTYNTAVYLKRCLPSSSISYLTAIGADFLSDELLFKMGEHEINTDLVFRSSSRNLGLYMIRNDNEGERTFAYWRNQSAATQTLNIMKGAEFACDWFYLSGISIAILDDEQRATLFELISSLKAKGSKIAFDPNYRARLWSSQEDAKYWTGKAYAEADLAFPGADDHLMLFGHTNADEIFSYLADKQIEEIVMKNGAVGVHILRQQEQCIVPVERVEQVVDTTAAGDAFNGGYMAARLAGRKPVESASYGAKVAATVITYPGAIISGDAFTNHIPSL